MLKVKFENKIIVLMVLFLLSFNNQIFADSGYKGHWPNEINAISGGVIKTDNAYIEAYVGAGEEFEKINTIIPNGVHVSVYGNIVKNGEKWSLIEVYEFDERKIKNLLGSWDTEWNREYYNEVIAILKNFMNNKDKIEFGKCIYGDSINGLSYIKIALKRSGFIRTEYIEG